MNEIRDHRWHSIAPKDVLSLLDVEAGGLPEGEVGRRRELYGANRLPEEKPAGVFRIFMRQFLDPLVYILLAALVISILIQHWNDAIFILAVLVLNATIGTVQEWKAQLSVQGLKEVIEEKTLVLRGGRRREIPSLELVPGDIVQLDSGRRVPADIRLLSAQNLRVDESLLTGESLPVEKDAFAEVEADALLGDRPTMLHAGSIVMDGRAEGVVCCTGAASEVGRIAESLTGRAGEPPLVLKMRRFTRDIAIFVLLAVAAVAGGQVAIGAGWGETLLLALALAVSAIPEGLPVAVTVALSVASHRMAERHVIVRRLPAVEGLGSCTTIASDKTGTLTENKLTVKTIVLPENGKVYVEGEGYVPEGIFMENEQPAARESVDRIRRLAQSGALCNEAEFRMVDSRPEVSGDTVDIAFLVLAAKLGIRREELERKYSKTGAIPFESERKFAAFFYRDRGRQTVHAKGAAERILPMCRHTDPDRVKAEEAILAREGYRVLAVASGMVEGLAESADEHSLRDLNFLGLVGLIDPVRREVPGAVKLCRQAGVKVVMVTGDHPATAETIARQIGLSVDGSNVLTGRDLNEITNDESQLDERIRSAQVFARFEPAQKIVIVESLRRKGEFVAVTGDGVNDAPALKKAHISVAMGKGGTDIARRVAELILTDDNFASIVNGIEEGRIAFDNVRKVIWLLISTGAAEVVLFLAALFTGMPLPLFAVQLLWLNLVTNGVQDVALAFEKKEPGIMKRPPRPPDQPVFDRKMIEETALSALVIGGIAFMAFYYMIRLMNTPEFEARNLLLLLMVLFENVHIFNCRSEYRSAFEVPVSANYLLIGTVVLAQGVHISAMYIPGLNSVLQIQPVTIREWASLLGLSLSVIVAMEIYKRFRS